MKYAALIMCFLQAILCWNSNVEGATCLTRFGIMVKCRLFTEDMKPNVTNSVCGVRPTASELLRVKRDIQLHKPESSIVGGKEAKPYSWPWIVSVLKNDGRSMLRHCGGCIISERYILSAAHCFPGKSVKFPRNYVIKVRSHNGTDGVGYNIEEIKRHPSYITGIHYYDIALLKIKGLFTFNKMISPACLPSSRDDYANEMATAIGWGKTAFHMWSVRSQVLQEVIIPVFSKDLCHMFYSNMSYISIWKGITDDMLCAGALEGGKGTCEGDSGGPLLHLDQASLKWKVIGIISFSSGCAPRGYPDGYTRVSSYLPWITENMDN